MDAAARRISEPDRRLLGGLAGFATFLIAVGSAARATGIEEGHALPATGDAVVGAALVLGSALAACGVAALAGGAGRRRSLRLLAIGVWLSAALAMLPLPEWEDDWLAAQVLVVGVLLHVLTRPGEGRDRRAPGRPDLEGSAPAA